MDMDTQRVLLALQKEALRWDARADIELYLGRAGKHRALQDFPKMCNSSHPTQPWSKLDPTNIKSDRLLLFWELCRGS